ncbi:MAG: DUF3568 family protein [Rhodospirillaceae bacterium]|nr:MAG: DUF3568 family protein [Rhodospirillaceae bacterium]
MKNRFLLGLFGVTMICAGCVNTVGGGKTGAVPFVKDRVQGRYERPVAQVHEAAKAVLLDNGVVTRDGTLLGFSNTVYAVEGKVNRCDVWIRIEAIEPRLTEVTVQARTKFGGRDFELVHELEKEIALKLSR